MTPGDFVLNIAMIFMVFLAKDKIVQIINEKLDLSFKFKPEWVSYILVVWLAIVIVMGMLFNKEMPFGNISVSDSMQKLEPVENKKPHRFFDINFDIFNF